MDLNTAIDVIESVAGFADADTSVGEAWAVVMAQLNAAPAPAGEVGELVQPPGRAGLTWQGVIEGLRDVLNDESEDAIQRVWQRSRILDAISVMEANPCPAPVPVAVSERPWEREGWCDSEGRCWIHCPGQSWDTWVLMVPQNAIDGAHCLPATALPLPQGEPQP